MATIVMSTDIDVLDKYNELVKESLSSDSIYIRTKETLDKLVTDGDITGPEKAKVIADVLGSLNTSIVNGSMGTALQWAAQEKELTLKKLEMEKQLDILDKEVLAKEASIDKITSDDVATQASNIRQNGMPTVVDGKVVALGSDGKVWKEMEVMDKTIEKADSDKELIDSRIKESNAGIHKIVADTYVNYGTFSGYTVTDSGIVNVSQTTPTGHTTLSELQAVIADEQAKGYAYNAWSNAASGLGATIGTALTTESDIFGGTASYPDILADWASTIKNLKNVQAPV